MNEALVEAGFLGGYDLSGDYPALGDAMLLCATELTSREDIDRIRAEVKKVQGGVPTTLVMRERPADNPRPTFRHHRGEFLQPK